MTKSECGFGPLVAVSANLAWNLVNFRSSLLADMIGQGFRVLVIAPPDPDNEAKLRALGCDFAPWAVDAMGLSPLRDLSSLMALFRVLRAHRPAAWLSWTVKPNIYGTLAARSLGIPAFPNVSGLGTVFIKRSLLTIIVQWLYRLAFHDAPTVFFQNADDRAIFIDNRLVTPGQARILPGSGVDLNRFRADRPGRPAIRNFLMIARVVGDKGVREFVKAARMVRQAWPDARFTLLGFVDVANRTAIAHAELQRWVDEGTIEYLEPTPDVRPAIERSDFIVLPSYREGRSRVLIEAAAMGRPMIVSNVPGCREIVSEGETGFLCAARDAVSLAQAMNRASQIDDDEWLRLSGNARRLAESTYSDNDIINLYRDALRDSGIVPPRRTAP